MTAALTSDGVSLRILDGAIRDIRVSGFRVLDAITVAARDPDWGTYPLTLDVVAATATEATLRGVHGDVFAWDGTVSVSPGSVRFELRGRVLRTFSSPRIGLCLLHPQALAGRSFETDAGPGRFGVEISPSPPASGFRRLRYSLGVPVDITLDAEFEMEDHRNWSDPGWKSYSPPLSGGSRTWPAGAEITQVVTVSGPVTVVPSIEPYGGGLVTLVAGSLPELRTAASRLADRGDITRVAVFDPASHTTAPGSALAVRQVLRDHGCAAPVGGGSRAHLAELNRMAATPEEWDFVTFPITAQAHHTDTGSVMATVRAQPSMVEQASRVAPGLPVVIAPLSFRPPAARPDPREHTAVGAAWLLGSVIALRQASAIAVLSHLDGFAALARLRDLRGRPFVEVPTGDPDLVAACVPGEATFAVNLGASPRSLSGAAIPGYSSLVLPSGSPR